MAVVARGMALEQRNCAHDFQNASATSAKGIGRRHYRGRKSIRQRTTGAQGISCTSRR
jgi:hypothetical protein